MVSDATVWEIKRYIASVAPTVTETSTLRPYHLIVNVSCQSAVNEYFSIYPNPGAGQFNVVINNSDIEGLANLNILDTKGGLVHRRSVFINSGINMYVVNQNLSTGVYFINIENGSSSTQVVKYCVR